MNRTFHPALGRLVAISLFCALAGPAGAQSTETAPVYKPPVRGAPASRVGGGSRGVGQELPRLYVLAPVDIGFTTKGKPDLFWFASDSSPAKVVVSVYTDDAAKPLLEQTLASVSAPGVQRVKLSDFGLELQPRTEYKWRVTLIDENPGRPARAVASGTIQRTGAWPKLLGRLQSQGTDAIERGKIYAEEGLWYDALESIGQAPEADLARAKKMRAALLEQVGLTEVGQFEAAGK